jgi:hypothetical protein
VPCAAPFHGSFHAPLPSSLTCPPPPPALFKSNLFHNINSVAGMDDCDRSVGCGAADEHPFESSSAKRTIKGQQGPVAACDYCRVRKVKCDGGLPCAFCVKKSVQCTYFSSGGQRRKKRMGGSPAGDAANSSEGFRQRIVQVSTREDSLTHRFQCNTYLDPFCDFVLPWIRVQPSIRERMVNPTEKWHHLVMCAVQVERRECFG